LINLTAQLNISDDAPPAKAFKFLGNITMAYSNEMGIRILFRSLFLNSS